MNREELIEYIGNCYAIGNIVTETSEIANSIEVTFVPHKIDKLLGSVYIDGLYIKKDSENKIYLTHYDGGYEELNLGDCIDVIDDYSFYDFLLDNNDIATKKLRRIFSKTVVKLGESAFQGSTIQAVNFPNLMEIGESCFHDSNLKEGTFNKLQIIPEKAFMGTQITEFKGDEVEVVEQGSFSGCKWLKSIILPKAKIIHLNTQEEIFDASSGIKIIAPDSCKFVC